MQFVGWFGMALLVDRTHLRFPYTQWGAWNVGRPHPIPVLVCDVVCSCLYIYASDKLQSSLIYFCKSEYAFILSCVIPVLNLQRCRWGFSRNQTTNILPLRFKVKYHDPPRTQQPERCVDGPISHPLTLRTQPTLVLLWFIEGRGESMSGKYGRADIASKHRGNKRGKYECSTWSSRYSIRNPEEKSDYNTTCTQHRS